jgi:FRG domain-containing protein
MEETRVETWLELQRELFDDMLNEELGVFRSDRAYRGRADARDDLVTSLCRLGGDSAELERHLLRNFRKYAAAGSVPVDTPWDWLALGKHHGLPTRLLDWTYSPYVALHFATAHAGEGERDCVVWTLDYVRAHDLLPDRLRERLAAEGANVFTTELLAEVAPSIDQLGNEEFVLFVEPPSFDERIVNQYALFSLMSRPDGSHDDWVRAHGELVQRIVIPAELAWEVRDKLDQANVTERVLFPGLDGLSAWLARHYRPRR